MFCCEIKTLFGFEKIINYVVNWHAVLSYVSTFVCPKNPMLDCMKLNKMSTDRNIVLVFSHK